MVEGAILNLTSLIDSLPASWISLGKGVLIFLGAASLLLILNIVYLIISVVLNFKRAKRLKAIEEKVNGIHRILFKKK